MIKKINAKDAEWGGDIQSLWDKHVAPKFAEGETCSYANYFTPRPYVDEYNRGSTDSGFVYTVQPGDRVAFINFSSATTV